VIATGRLARARETLRLAWHADPSTTRWLLAITTVLTALPLATALTGKAIIDAVVAQSADRALALLGLEGVFVGLLVGLGRATGYLRSVLATRLALSVNLAILRKTLTMRLEDFEDPIFHDRLTRARREASSRPVAMASELLSIAQSALTLAGYAGLLISFSPLAVLVLALAALPATAAELRFSRAAYALRHDRVTDGRRLNYLEYVLASADYAKEVILLGLGPLLLGRYVAVGERVIREDVALSRRRVGSSAFFALVGTLAFYGCYAWIVWLAVHGELTLGQLSLYAVSFQQGQLAFQSVMTGLGSLYEHDLYMANLFGFLSAEIPAMGAAIAPGPAPLAPERGVRFQGVRFRYPGQERWALDGVDLFIPAGQRIAIVGLNGAGKSTFIKLLCALYTPTEGRVLLDGQDVHTLAPHALRERLAVAFQDFSHFQTSARENVGFGSVAHLDDGPRVTRAVDSASAAELVRQLPQGVETPLGRWFPGGVELSGGQWQRVALARTFMREQADLIVLDEPTAALDIEGERAVFESLLGAAAGRTVVLISHRFPAVRQADHIVVLDAGRIVESGAHDVLSAAAGRYAELFEKQAEGYRA
jgi:ATP-binding cassette subfamily B protein